MPSIVPQSLVCREKFWQVPWSLRLSPRLACSISFNGRVMGRVEVHSRKVGKAHSIVELRLKNPTKQGEAHSSVGLRLKTSTINSTVRLRRRRKKIEVNREGRHCPFLHNTFRHESGGKCGAGASIVECIMPCPSRTEPFDLFRKSERFNQISKRI